MTICCRVGVLAFSASLCEGLVVADRVPQFADYRAAVFVGQAAIPRFVRGRVGGKMFPEGDLRCVGTDAERMRRFSGLRPNFAGHYVLYRCSCGSGCVYPFVWDAKSGDIVRDLPFGSLDIGAPSSRYGGMIFEVGSRLLIADGRFELDNPDESQHEVARKYFLLVNRKFRMIKSIRK